VFLNRKVGIVHKLNNIDYWREFNMELYWSEYFYDTVANPENIIDWS